MAAETNPTDADQNSLPADLPVELVEIGQRQRRVDPAKVENLRVSIRENGFFGAILVRPIEGAVGSYQLVAGAHRLTAMQLEGRKTIPAHVRVLSDDEAEQIEIDENLVRGGLTPLERAEAIAARFAVWRRRHPDRVVVVEGSARPKPGRPGNAAKFAEFLGGAPETMGFTAATAVDVGLSKRTVAAAWATINGLPVGMRNALRGSWVSKNEGVLRQLAAIGDRAEQAAVADLLIQGQTKSVSAARAIAAGNTPSKPAQTPADEAVKAFRKLWNGCSPSARDAILHELAGLKTGRWTVVEADRG